MAEPQLALCVDVGSTFTKAVLVDLVAHAVVATASHRTTVDTDVLHGYDAVRDALVARDPRARDAEVLACSSAGGGLRIAVVGNEPLVSAEAGRRVALSSGGKVVFVGAVAAGADWIAALPAAAPDVVLLTGGTDGGNPDPLVDAARGLVASRWRGPVVVAGCAEAQPEAASVLTRAGCAAVRAENVVPRIGVLAPGVARAAVRETFLAHVIGGKGLSADPRFAAMVRGATPDVVLTGVEMLARGLDEERPGIGDVAVVDLGGATTDVYSVVEVDPDRIGREVVATTMLTRTVEADLGMRWSAMTTVEEGYAAGLVAEQDVDGLRTAAAMRHDDPGHLGVEAADLAADVEIARVAVGLATRRHAGRWRQDRSTEGRDLREVALLVAGGGALRSASPEDLARIVVDATGENGGGWQLPRAAGLVVDRDQVLMAAGLLATRHPETAYALVSSLST